MTAFVTLEGEAVAIEAANIDTDQIIPARFLRKDRSVGYQNFLFRDLRQDPAFPLNGHAPVVFVTGPNFGCGSSREGAVYALVDAGIRCVIAASFGDIFASNAAKNGLLTINLPEFHLQAMRSNLPGRVAVDLPAQRVRWPDRHTDSFEIDPFRKRCLIEDLDDIALTFEHRAAIDAFCACDRSGRPWAQPG